MSLILEALRKSEAERRRGQAPDLFAAPGARIEQRRTPRSAWPGLLAAVLVLVSALWAGRALWLEQSAESERAAAEQAPMANAAPRFEAAPEETGVAAVPTPTPMPTPNSSAAPVAADSVAATVAPAPVAAESAPPPVASTASAPPDTARTAPSADDAIGAAAAASRPAALPTEPMAPPPLRLADLGPDERAALPPLRLSMHVWTAEPGTRFAIVDGARLGEGARVGDAVVAEITRDGLVLAWQGRRLHVPRP